MGPPRAVRQDTRQKVLRCRRQDARCMMVDAECWIVDDSFCLLDSEGFFILHPASSIYSYFVFIPKAIRPPRMETPAANRKGTEKDWLTSER